MFRKKGLKPETVKALRAVLGGDDGADVTIDADTGKIAIKDGKINVELSVPDILKKQEAPPKTKS